jgi:phenylacetate-CoA ligase
MLVMPNGERRWPLVGFSSYREIAPIRQYQLVQKTVEKIEVRLVVDRALTTDEEARLAGVIRAALGHAFELAFVYLPIIPLTAGGKFEEFVSEVPGA